jgi:hypothetical protein
VKDLPLDVVFRRIDRIRELYGPGISVQVTGGDPTLRDRRVARAMGLRLAVVFNTTVHAGNLEEVPALARFFLSVSDVVGMASFQLQAETGRGEIRTKEEHVTMPAIRQRITRGLLATRGKTGKLTFFIQNFQPAEALDPERIRNCSFMVMTDDGQVLHGLRRALSRGAHQGPVLQEP